MKKEFTKEMILAELDNQLDCKRRLRKLNYSMTKEFKFEDRIQVKIIISKIRTIRNEFDDKSSEYILWRLLASF